jgi:hypothetical protein
LCVNELFDRLKIGKPVDIQGFSLFPWGVQAREIPW